MRRFALLVPLTAALVLIAALPAAADHQGPQGQQVGGGPQEGDQPFNPHLFTLGFDPLGPPSSGLNSEIVFDSASRIAYLGSLNFDADEFGTDPTVKVVDVTDPTNPELVAAVTPIGDLGPFDVKIAGNVLAASVQGFPESNPGVTLFDITNRRSPIFASHIGEAQLRSPFGSHNSFLWQDPITSRVWLFATGLDLTSLQIYDVTDPFNPVFTAEYEEGGYIHDNFVNEVGGRVFEYTAGTQGVEILDVTRIVRGNEAGLLTFESDVVAFNHYTSMPPGTPPVTRPRFAHYIEPTESGNVTWVGDETICEEPGIIHAFDSTALPTPPAKKPLEEIGVIIESPDALMCEGVVNGHSLQAALSQWNSYRWTGHNFDVVGDNLLVRGDYGRGVYVYDISNPANAGWVAKSRGLNELVGAENKVEPGRDKLLENYPWFWQAVFDPVQNLILGSNINQGMWVLKLQPNT